MSLGPRRRLLKSKTSRGVTPIFALFKFVSHVPHESDFMLDYAEAHISELTTQATGETELRARRRRRGE